MGALSAGRQVRDLQISGTREDYAGQKGNTIVYAGGMVQLDGSGYVRPGSSTSATYFVPGVASTNRDLDRYDATTTGPLGQLADGVQIVRWKEGIFGMDNDSGSPIVATTQPGTILFVVDDHTVSLSSSSGTRAVAGRLDHLNSSTTDDGQVYVIMSKAIGKQCMDEIYGSSLEQPLAVAQGGSGAGTFTAHGVMVGEGTSAMVAVAPSATVGVPLMSQGSAADPAYTGQVPIANGGTGAATASANLAFIGPASGAAAAPSFRALGAGDVPLACFHVASGVAGHNGAGALTVAAAKVGDKVIMASYTGATPPTSDPLSALEATVSIAGQVQQTDGANLSAGHFSILLIALS